MLSRRPAVQSFSLSLLIILFSGLPQPVEAQDLEISLAQRRWKIDALQREGRDYYRLKDLAAVVGLELEERGGMLTVEGTRGTLLLVDDRPLLRFEDHYVLLSGPAWRRGKGDWYVTEDFLTEAVPLVVNRRLEKRSNRRYRMSEIDQNPVQVRVANYPDHVRIVFESERKAPVKVQEREKYIEVKFERYLVQPKFPTKLPNHRVVSSVGFDSTDVYGTFRIYKGELYDTFRELTLSDPDRKVIDVYRAPEAGARKSRETPPFRSSSTVAPPPRAAKPDRRVVAAPPEVVQNVITIDPGHGGEDYGVSSFEFLLEKNLTLKIAVLLQERLRAMGHQGMLTRNRDVELGVEQRSSVGNYYDSRLYLSLHAGGSLLPEIGGPVVYIHRYPDLQQSADGHSDTDSQSSTETETGTAEESEKSEPEGLISWHRAHRKYVALSRELAGQLQSELNQLWGTENEVIEVPLQLLVPVTAPAVLIELGFLTNPEDQQKLYFPHFQSSIAATIASTLSRFLKTSSVDSRGAGSR